ncbi:MAG TPA: c-type cytochrome domain-containing protein [Tepidisphaeraceae bacterium]|jgi:hypothetical protein|nr:c-type cytochrome domain-containing protein [Tepidisphaeraceae bacterium]
MSRSTKYSILTCAAVSALFSLSAQGAEKTNYQDDVLPLFRNNCLNCHNPDKKKAGLDLSTYQHALAGSNNGPVINSGDPEGSLLYKVVTHAEDPTMPPKKDKLPDKELNIIKEWIAAGALETATGKPAVSAKPKIDMAVAAGAMKKPDGPPPMPHDLLPEPVVRADRAWATACMATSPWAPVVAIGGQHQILLYNTDSLDLLGIVPYTDGEPQVVQFSRNGRVLLVGGGVAAKSGKVNLWDVTTGQKITDIGDEFDSVLAADISPDQSYVCLGGPTKVFKVYATRDGSLVHVIKKHTDWVTACSFSPDGVLMASGDRAGGLFVWESKTGAEFYNLAGHKAAITSVAFRDDANILASASEDGTVKLWDMQSGKEAKSWQAHSGGVLSVAFTHDGRLVTCGRDHVVKIWKPDGSQIRAFDAFSDIALHATFDYVGNRVIAGDWTGELRVWNAADGKLIGHLNSNPPPLAERLANAEKHAAELQPTCDKAVADASAAQAAVDKLQLDEKTAQANAANAKKQIETCQAQMKSAEESMHSAEAAKKTAEAALPEKQSAIDRLTKTIAEATTNRDAAGKLVQAAKDNVDSIQKQFDAAKSAADAAQDEASKKPDDAGLAAAAKDKKSAMESAQNALASAKTGMKERADQAAKISDDLNKAQGELAKAKDALEAGKKALADQAANVEKFRAAHNEADAALNKAKAELAAADKSIAPMAGQIKAATANAAKAKTAADAGNKELAAAKAEIIRLHVGQFFLTVYSAKQELAAKQTEFDQMTAAVKSVQAELDNNTAAISGAEKAMAEAPTRLKQEEAAIAKAKEAVAPAQAADQAAQAALAQKQAFLTEANALATKLWVEAPKTPGDKALGDAAAKARNVVESLTADVDATKPVAAAKADAFKAAGGAVASAEQLLAKDKADLASYPKKIEGWKQALAASQADLPKRKTAADAAAKTVADAKAKVDHLNAEYQKKSQEAGLTAEASAQKS